MPKKSKVRCLEPEAREYLNELLRADRYTLKELLAAVRAKFPDADLPVESGLSEYRASFEKLAGRMRDIDRASNALVGELGEGIGEKSGALLAQAVTTLVTDVVLKAQSNEELSYDDACKLARASNLAIDTRRISLAERKAIEKEAIDRAMREQREKVEALGKQGEIPADVLAKVIKAAYGL